MKQNNQKEDRRNFLKNIGFGLLGISVLSNFSFENFLGSKALAKELPDFKIEGKKRSYLPWRKTINSRN